MKDKIDELLSSDKSPSEIADALSESSYTGGHHEYMTGKGWKLENPPTDMGLSHDEMAPDHDHYWHPDGSDTHFLAVNRKTGEWSHESGVGSFRGDSSFARGQGLDSLKAHVDKQ